MAHAPITSGDVEVGASSRLPLVGVGILDLTLEQAQELFERALDERRSAPLRVYFVNAHTLMLATEDERYRSVLAAADWIFGDGTGVRWAVRWVHGTRLRDNVNGTDLLPRLLASDGARRRSCFLLGASSGVALRAVETARQLFPAWDFVGSHHGYVEPDACDDVIARINAAKPDLLLVGMGNPRQELWIHENYKRLDVAMCCGVGGLFDYWGGGLRRAPAWMRSAGVEWLHLMVRQPRKLRRYLVGGPQFLIRVARSGRVHGRRQSA
jgi:N-acetylglucosaminyldiphosphoundecaprenol N-acetyl-beta-D-mannosaminyltransferase